MDNFADKIQEKNMLNSVPNVEKTFDSLLIEIGEYGRYQRMVFWLLAIPCSFMNAYNAFSLVFIAFTPEHTCIIPESVLQNETTTNTSLIGECDYMVMRGKENETLKCDYHKYDETIFKSTIITKFELVCDREIYSKNMMGSIQAMVIVGCLVYAYIMDRWGRRIAFYLNLITYLVGSIASVFMPTLITFTLARIVSGVNKLATWNICFIWILEFIGPSERTWATAILCVLYGAASTSLSLIAYFCVDYVQFGLAVSVPFVLLFLYPFIIMESPRWLLSKGRVEDAEAVLKKMMRKNGNPREDLNLKEYLKAILLRENQEKLGDSPKLTDLFRTPELRKKTLIICAVFISSAVLYTVLNYFTEHLPGNFFILWAAMSIVEAPATAINIFILDIVGRIRPMAFTCILSGLLLLLAAFMENVNPWLVAVLAISGKFCITATYSIIYQAGGELLPTPVRGLGIGFASTIGDGLNVAFPYIIYSATVYKMLPLIIIGIIAISGGFSSLFLPETLYLPMAQTLTDGEVGKVNLTSFRRNCCLKKRPTYFETKPIIGREAYA